MSSCSNPKPREGEQQLATARAKLDEEPVQAEKIVFLGLGFTGVSIGHLAEPQQARCKRVYGRVYPVAKKGRV